MHNGALARSRRSDGLSRGPIPKFGLSRSGEKHTFSGRKIPKTRCGKNRSRGRRANEGGIHVTRAYDSINFQRIRPSVFREQLNTRYRSQEESGIRMILINACKFFSLDIEGQRLKELSWSGGSSSILYMIQNWCERKRKKKKRKKNRGNDFYFIDWNANFFSNKIGVLSKKRWPTIPPIRRRRKRDGERRPVTRWYPRRRSSGNPWRCARNGPTSQETSPWSLW